MSDAPAIARTLGGRWRGSYGRACCPACGDTNSENPALSIRNGVTGSLLLWCFKGCSFSEILAALNGMGLVDGTGAFRPPSPEDIRQHRAEVEAEAVKRADQAYRCWQEAGPISGTPAEAYLRSRGITFELPDTLRFHPDCWHAGGKRFSAMVAMVEGSQRFAIHRTYLEGPRKADVTPNKAMLGSVKGGAVRLTEGDGPLVVAEGIETALSLACGPLRGPATIWAALSAGGMKALNLPEIPGRLTVASDGDAAGRAAGQELASRAHALGWSVSLLPAPEGRDWNDVIRAKEVSV
ncbi:DUF7146 domain-containing protein [Tropicimonas aquimaris]|uniref:Toprim domain-containing protein n=1 Tax=Tropicimonas aquimaris TaxID=914152 RepID=A0ABW3INF7_9RHOB